MRDRLSARLGEHHLTLLKNLPGIARAGIAVGIAVGAHGDDFKVAIRIMRQGGSERIIREFLQTLDPRWLDIKHIGGVHAAGLRLTHGASLSHYLDGAGTLACEVFDAATRDRMLLSNNHVLAFDNRAVRNDEVIHPGQDEGGSRDAGIVGFFERCIHLSFNAGENFVDAAVARVKDGVEIALPTHPGYVYTPEAVEQASRQDVVYKVGNRSGFTTGRITAVDVDQLSVAYGDGYAEFFDQIEVNGDIGNFAWKGDSGSLLIDKRSSCATGLLFAVNGKGVAYANPIGRVLEKLSITLQ